MNILGWLLCASGATILLIAALGLVRLPDALSRQHAGTKAVTLAVLSFALGIGLLAWDSAWTWRLILLALVLMLTLPLASHALARAGVMERGPDGQD
ncbi:MAG: monovalent cation/H(+) antiporter subunit G [Betaproteobacteria bacterium]|nr:MAG: monovalent cation/H(+) antiporter subunit G [Betaproteobacteria bacterium]